MFMSKERESQNSLPERWSAKAKSEVVLRLFRGEGVDEVSREIVGRQTEWDNSSSELMDTSPYG